MSTRSMRSRSRLSDAVKHRVCLKLPARAKPSCHLPSVTRHSHQASSPPLSSSLMPTKEKVNGICTTTNGVIVSKSDVLLGRGRHIESHEGNVQFHLRMEQHLRGYKVLRARPAKNRYTSKIVKQMKKSGIRFLKQNSDSVGASEDNAWYEVDDEIVRMKVGQSLRYLRRRNSSDGADASKSKEARSWANINKPLKVGSECLASSPKLHSNQGDKYAAVQRPFGDEIATSSDQSFAVYLEEWEVGLHSGDISPSQKGTPVRVDDFFMPDV